MALMIMDNDSKSRTGLFPMISKTGTTASEVDGANTSRFASETFVSFSSSRSSETKPSAVINESYQSEKSDKLPKDGFRSWVACVVAFLDTLILYGMLNIYSLFLVQFQEDMDATLTNAGLPSVPNSLATLGSMTYGLVQLFGPVSSYLAMRFGNRLMMILGSLVCGACTYGSSYVETFNLLFVTFGVPYALGTALVNVPAFVVPMEYFKKNQAITTGIIASGSSMGMVLLAPIIQPVLETFGWRTAFRGLSFSFIVLAIVNFLMKPLDTGTPKKVENENSRSLWEDLKLWNNRVFVLWVAVIAIVYFGYNIPVMFLVIRASYAVFVGSTPNDAAFMFVVMGAATTVSRLATGGLMTCDLLSRLHVKQIIFVLMGTVHLLLTHITTVKGLYMFAVVRGLLDGAHIVMLPNLTASIVGAKRAILGWGHLAGAISISYTLGPLAAGALMAKTGSYVGPFIMAGLPLILAGLMLFLLPWAQRSFRAAQLLKKMSSHYPSTHASLLPVMVDLHVDAPMESIEDYIQHHVNLAEAADKLVRTRASEQSDIHKFDNFEPGPGIVNFAAGMAGSMYYRPLSMSASDTKLMDRQQNENKGTNIRKSCSDTALYRKHAIMMRSSF